MECCKPNRWRMFYFLYPLLRSTRIVFASFWQCPPWLSIDSGWYCLLDGLDIGTSFFRHWWFRIRFFATTILQSRRDNLFHIIYKVSIDTWDIHQIKEDVEVKPNRLLSIQTTCGSTLVNKINSNQAAIVKFDNLKTRNWRLDLLTLFSPLNW